MRKLFVSILVSLLLFSLFFLFVNSISVSTQEEYVPNEVLLKFKKGVSKNFIQDAINSIQGKIITFQAKKN